MNILHASSILYWELQQVHLLSLGTLKWHVLTVL
jgi:hypothetical protein